MLAGLQRPPDQGIASLSGRIVAAAHRLPAAAAAHIQRCHERLAAALAAGHRRDWSFLHADFHPRNVILSGGGPVKIDPFGLAGPPAWDLAQFAAIAYGGAQLDERPPLGHDAILERLVAGFGRTPALLEETATYWLMLVHRLRRRLGRESSWVDTVVEEYSTAAPCRARRSISIRARREPRPRRYWR